MGVYEIASRVVPARHVGGDFVCSFEHGDKAYVVLGDLMGKGLSAAMWISHTIDLVHRAAEGMGNVSDILSRLNLEILHSRVRAPLTSAIAFVIDPSTDIISRASAGNPPAVVLRDGADTLVTTAGGPLLGAFPDAHYSREDIHLARASRSSRSPMDWSRRPVKITKNSRSTE